MLLKLLCLISEVLSVVVIILKIMFVYLFFFNIIKQWNKRTLLTCNYQSINVSYWYYHQYHNYYYFLRWSFHYAFHIKDKTTIKFALATQRELAGSGNHSGCSPLLTPCPAFYNFSRNSFIHIRHIQKPSIIKIPPFQNPCFYFSYILPIVLCRLLNIHFYKLPYL